MAKAGSPSRVEEKSSHRSAETRKVLVDAAVETLKQNGYGGASARAIAERAGSNQGLVFYHFGSVAGLLLAALDAVSADRLDRYDAAVDEIGNLTDLVDVARTIYGEDLDSGSVTVLAEMIAGASSSPGLGPEVVARIAPWVEFAERAVENTLGRSPIAAILPIPDIAYGIVALYLGLEMLSHLDGDRERALALFSHASRLAELFQALNGPAPKGAPTKEEVT
jgi:AcrR family transcriptional regulator